MNRREATLGLRALLGVAVCTLLIPSVGAWAQEGAPSPPMPNPSGEAAPPRAFSPGIPADSLPILPGGVSPAEAPGLDGLTPRLETESGGDPRPNLLRRPIDPIDELPAEERPWPGMSLTDAFDRPYPTQVYPFDPPAGFTGPSGVLPTEPRVYDEFVPVEDRWRTGYPFYDRYDRGNRFDDDYPYDLGKITDPYNQNVLKGDFPIYGQNLFVDILALTSGIYEGRTLPTPASGGFESTARPFEENFFGRSQSLLVQQNFVLAIDLFHGDAGFKPIDWRIKITPVLNVNTVGFEELAIVSPNVLAGNNRTRTFWTVQEHFAEFKLRDLSPYYDFVSIRAGSQPYVHDFRGFLFFNTNRGVRIFGNNNSNRDQFNLVYFRPYEIDTNSFLNSFNDRYQNLVFANFYRQDFLVPGYTTQWSFAYDNDEPNVKYDKNRFLVRPDAAGNFRPRQLDAFYLGWAGEGHFGRYNIMHQFYWALGRDQNNPIANRAQTINAQFFAVELSYDRDWVRFKGSFLWQSGDANPNNTTAAGFDTILDNPNFAGGQFSFYQRQALPLFNVFLTQRNSFVNDLRSSKVQGQANFVNPGLVLGNLGMDLDLTPKLKMFNNANLLWFDQTAPLEQFLFDGNIHDFIGADLSTGFEYRPLVSENVAIVAGVATLIGGQGFNDLYDNIYQRRDALVQGFANVILAY